jgi:hypothetical protein
MEKMTPPGRTFCFHRNLTPFVKDQFVLVSKFIGKHLPSTSTCPSNIKFDIESIILEKYMIKYIHNLLLKVRNL